MAQNIETARGDIKHIQNEYRWGRIGRAREKLDSLFANPKLMAELSATEKASTYELAAKCYLLNGNPDLAQASIEHMLLYIPNYKDIKGKETDIEEFNHILDKLYVLPKLQFNMQAGTSHSVLNNISTTSVMVYEADIAPKIEYRSGLGLMLGLGLEYDFNPHFSLTSEFGVNQISYSMKRSYTGIYSGLDEVQTTQTLLYSNASLMMSYKLFPMSKNRLVLGLGGGLSFLLSSNKKIQSINAPFSTMNQMRRSLSNIQIRAGYLHIFHKYSLGANLTYVHYLTSISTPEAKFRSAPEESQIIYAHYTVPDKVTMGALQLSLSFRYFLSYKVYRKKK